MEINAIVCIIMEIISETETGTNKKIGIALIGTMIMIHLACIVGLFKKIIRLIVLWEIFFGVGKRIEIILSFLGQPVLFIVGFVGNERYKPLALSAVLFLFFSVAVLLFFCSGILFAHFYYTREFNKDFKDKEAMEAGGAGFAFLVTWILVHRALAKIRRDKERESVTFTALHV